MTSIGNIWNGLEPGVSKLADVEATLGAAQQVTQGVMYVNSGPYTLLGYASEVASIFLKGGVVALMAIGAPDENGLPVRESEWREAAGPPQDYLPSRLGKNHFVMIYARRGLAVHVEDGKVRIVEMFAPMPPSEYKRTLYETPPVWRK